MLVSTEPEPVPPYIRSTEPWPNRLTLAPLARGRAFEEEAAKVGLEMVPFDAGFFASIPCSDPDGISAQLEKQGLFIVPLAKGLRVSVASVSEEKCRRIPAMIKAVMG